MTGDQPWFHNHPIPLEKIVFTERCQQRNKNLNPRILAKIRTAFAQKNPHEHTRPKKLHQKWAEGVYVGDARFQLNCTEKDGLVLITSMSYDRRAFKRAKEW